MVTRYKSPPLGSARSGVRADQPSAQGATAARALRRLDHAHWYKDLARPARRRRFHDRSGLTKNMSRSSFGARAADNFTQSNLQQSQVEFEASPDGAYRCGRRWRGDRRAISPSMLCLVSIPTRNVFWPSRRKRTYRRPRAPHILGERGAPYSGAAARRMSPSDLEISLGNIRPLGGALSCRAQVHRLSRRPFTDDIPPEARSIVPLC